MSTSDEQWIFLKNISKLINYIESLGWKASGGELYRPKVMQELYYYGYTLKFNNGVPEIVKLKNRKSKTLKSNHQMRKAKDFNIWVLIDGKLELTYKKVHLQKVGDYWESLHPRNRWGGNYEGGFIDTPHFEMI